MPEQNLSFLEKAIHETNRLIKRTSFSLIRPEFGNWDAIYAVSTENLSYLQKLPVKNKDILTVSGSFDHCLNLAYYGANKIDNFDVNYLTYFYGLLKYYAMFTLSYSEFFYFFLHTPQLETQGTFCFHYEIYKKIQPSLPDDIRTYWDQVYEIFEYDSKKLVSSALWNSPQIDLQKVMLSNPYLQSEKNYQKTQKNLQTIQVNWLHRNLLEIGEEEAEKYDLMLFSNIESYLVEDPLQQPMTASEYKQFICEKASKELKPGGQIQICYEYGYHTPIVVYGSLLHKLFQKKYEVCKNPYFDDSYKKIVFRGHSLYGALDKDARDCVYIYEKPEKVRK